MGSLPRKMSVFQATLGALAVCLWISETQPKETLCPFVTNINKCCKLPFVYNNRTYTECTADVTSEQWTEQWRRPWCFLDSTEGKKGFKHPCIRNTNSCGGIRTKVAGVISSDNFPHKYRRNSSCIWRIKVASAKRINLNFTDFQLEQNSRCHKTYVRVHDGSNLTDPVLASFCGSELPTSVSSTGNEMLVVFQSSSHGDTFKGFRAYYDSGECAVRSYGGNGGGACCVFPFTYKGKTYNKCTTVDATNGLLLGDLWCSVTSDYDRDRKRGLCVIENASCGANKFECKNSHWWRQCIDKKYHCDGHAQCADQSDEMDCPPMVNPDLCTVYHAVEIPNKKNAVGYVVTRMCGYKDRCGNETNIQDPSKPCNFSNWFKCSNNLCVPDYWRCDGKDDCGDRSDERGICPYQFAESTQACSWITHCVSAGWEDSLGDKQPTTVKTLATCQREDLDVIPTYLLVKITNLLLPGKKITIIDNFSFARYDYLEKIDLEGNRISKILPSSFKNLRILNILNLKGNQLKILEPKTFEGLDSLSELNLLGNPVEKIEADAFNGLKSLKELNLTNLELKSISAGAFRGMRSLKRLYLGNNKDLHQVPLDVFDDLPLSFLEADHFEFCCIAKLSGPNCSAPKDLFSSCNDLMANLTLRLSIWILGCIALFGNMFVLIWRLKTRSDSKVHALLLLNLAIADFLMGIYLILIASVDYYYRGKYFVYNNSWKLSPLCQFSGFVSTISSEASVFILTTMTLDRYVTIVHPLKHIGLNVRGTYIVLFFIWLVAFVLAGVPLTGISYFKEFYARSGVCLPLQLTADKLVGWEYSVFVFLALNFASFMLIFFLYLVMFLKIQSTREMSGAGPAVSSIGSRMVFIVLTDFCCWIPIIIIGVSSLLGMQASPAVYAWIAVFVLPLNSALNPILYTISTANFRRKIRGTVRRRSRKSKALLSKTDQSLFESKYVTNSSSRSTATGSSDAKLLNGLLKESDV